MSVAELCLEADRLLAEQQAAETRLAEARRDVSQLAGRLEAAVRLRNRGHLGEAKAEAHHRYRQALRESSDPSARQQAAARWLAEISRLNRTLLPVAADTHELELQVSQAESVVHRLELEADASRVRAEAARAECDRARRALAGSHEIDESETAANELSAVLEGQHAPIAGLLNGNRLVLHQVVLRLAGETGQDIGQLQAQLAELAEAIAASALQACAIGFPAGHRFWDRLAEGEAQAFAASLAQLGYRYDGHAGWLDGLVPQPRHVALALAHAGLEHHVRLPLAQPELDELWQGARLLTLEHLATHAPQLSLTQVQRLVGPGSAALSELWDHWPQLRRVLLS